MKKTLTQIAAEIRSHHHAKQPVLIGIEGFGGSGKTTLANKLSQLLGSSYVVNIDDFIIKEKITQPSWDKGGFDRSRLECEVLKPASSGEPVSYQKLLWSTNTLSAPKSVPAVEYLIIEGISCYHPDLAHYYDYKIWVDTPMDVAKQRGHARDGSNENAKYWDMWAENDLVYQAAYHPEHVADFVISNQAAAAAYDIVLLPSSKLADAAIAASRHLQSQGTYFTLGPDTYQPHLSLFMLQLNSADIGIVSQYIEHIAHAYSSFELKATAYSQARGYLSIGYQSTPLLNKLQDDVLETIHPLRTGMAPEDTGRMQRAEGAKRRYSQLYGYPDVRELFTPHLTLTRFTTDDVRLIDSLPPVDTYTGLYDTIALFERGDNGTCVKPVYEYVLD